MSQTIQGDGFGTMGREVKRDLKDDLDAKIIITSTNSKPGLGKTTLAILMARAWDPHGWSAEEKAFMSVGPYREAYLNEPSRSVLVFDEMEGAADKRRAMSHGNVDLSQTWAQLRYKNKVSICTLPTTSMLDSRFLEMSDWWVNVTDRGVAQPYRIRVNDYNGKVRRQRVDGQETLFFDDLPDDDSDYEYLASLKDERARNSRKTFSQSEHYDALEKAREEAKVSIRNRMIRSLYESTDLSQREIGELEPVNLSKQRIGEICRSE